MQILSLVFLLLMPLTTSAAGEDIFGELFGRPELKLQTKFAFGFQGYRQVNLKTSAHELRLRKHSVDGSVPLSSDLMDKWKLIMNASYQELSSGARFQNQRPLPNRLMDMGAGFSHSRLLENGHTFAQSFLISSQSDQPFGAWRDTSFQANLIYKKPAQGESAWLFFLNVANNRGFLPYVPIPGFAYYFKASENLRILAGLPFFSIFWTPLEKTVFTFSYFPVRYASARLAYYLFGPAHIYLSSKFQSENHLISDRADKKERLFYEEGISQLGFTMPLEQNLLLDGSIGYSYSRKFFLARKTSERKSAANFISPKNAALLSVKLIAVF